jgi:hypothetical protein
VTRPTRFYSGSVWSRSLETGLRTSTYKLATLMALIDYCIENMPERLLVLRGSGSRYKDQLTRTPALPVGTAGVALWSEAGGARTRDHHDGGLPGPVSALGAQGFRHRG